MTIEGKSPGSGASLAARFNNRSAGRELRKELADLITEEDTEAALNTLRDCLKAERPAREGRDSTGGPNYTMVPDHTIRVTAANLLLQHKHGKPVQRNLLTVDKPDDGETLSKEETIRRLAGSLEHVVEIAKTYQQATTAIDGAKRVDEVIDTESMPNLPEFNQSIENQ